MRFVGASFRRSFT